MPCNNKYNFSLSTNLIDNVSQTRVLNFRIINCGDFQLENSCESTYNNNLCDNDAPYYSPVPPNGLLSFQLSFVDNRNIWPTVIGNVYTPGSPSYPWAHQDINFLVGFEVIDCCCSATLIIANSPAIVIGANVMRSGDNFYQNITIDTTTLPDCFAFKFYTWDGREYFTDCYNKIICDNIVCLKGLDAVGKINCNKEFIGLPYVDESPLDNLPAAIPSWFPVADTVSFINQICILGEFKKVSSTLNKEYLNNTNKLLNAKRTDIYSIISEPIPEYVANRVISVLSASSIEVNGIVLTFNGDVAINTDLGNQWIIDIKLETVICNLDSKCS